MTGLFETLPTPVLAFATTLHLAMAALRNHRSPGRAPLGSLAVVSTLLSATPWLFHGYAGLAFGFLAHTIWYAACERFAPPAPRPSRAPGPSVSPGLPAAPTSPGLASTGRAPTSRPKGFVPVPVLAVLEETADIRTFRLARPAGFDFVAGQFLPIRMRTDGRDHVRCYSISSAPESAGYIEISVKRQGLVSAMLHATLRPGSMLHVKAPAGSFVYPASDDRPLLLVAGGIGITPVLSMLRHAVTAEPTRQVTLLYSARTEDDFAFRDELSLLARRHPQIRVVFAASRAEAGANVYPGRIDEALIRATSPDVGHAVALMCGPQPMIDGLRSTLLALGMPAGQIRSELFEAVVAATGGADAESPAPVATAGLMHEVRCARSGTALSAPSGQTLLEAVEAGGVAIDSICRSGVCGTCRTRVIEGDVDCDSTMLDDAERRDGFVLACVTRIRGNCVIEA